jgi:hypothetical protein
MGKRISNKKLTENQLLFCKEYAFSNNATQAYLLSNPDVTHNTARTEGSRLLAKPDIMEEVNKQKEILANKYDISKEKMIKKIEDKLNRMDGDDFNNPTWAKLIDMLNKMGGHYIQKVDVTSGGNPISIQINLDDKEENE